MPVILNEEYLIPPSMRRNRMHNRDFDGYGDRHSSYGTTTMTMDLPPHRPMSPPRSPLIVHHDHYVPVEEVKIIRDVEYIVPAHSHGGSAHGSSTYYRGRDMRLGGSYEAELRSRSLGPVERWEGPPMYNSSDDYYLEDGTNHGGLRVHRHRHRHRSRSSHHSKDHHDKRHLLEGTAAAAAAYEVGKYHHSKHNKHSRSQSRGRHHGVDGKRVAEAGLAAAALGAAMHKYRSKSRDAAHQRDEEHSDHRKDENRSHKGLYLAEAGLGVAAAGAAKEFYDHRRRSSSVSSPQHERSHTGRNLALGATAAEIAHHRHHRNKSRSRRSSSVSSSSDDTKPENHRGRNLAGAALGATVVGLAAKKYYDRRGSRSQSSTSSDSSDSERGHRKHSSHMGTLGKVAGTAAAAGIAKGLYDRNRDHSRSPSRSRSKSRSGRSHGVNAAEKVAYTMAGALAEKHHRKKHHEKEEEEKEKHRRHRSAHRSDVHPGEQGYYESETTQGFSSDGERRRRGAQSHGLASLLGGHDSHGGNNGRAKGGLGEALAYKMGESVYEGITGRSH
ncbi:hypothetical protein RUND412_007627 [Rhizina undulata]